MPHGRTSGDAFVVKLNPTGDQFLYATYIGGTDYEQPAGLAVDGDGNAYVAGRPIRGIFRHQRHSASRRGLTDGFVAKLDPNGVVVYSTAVSRRHGEDVASGIASTRSAAPT